MTRLSADNLLKEHQTRDPNSITSLTLTHKALSDVSCLSDFKNLERLDLSFNNLSSLEGLKSCVNLKWLSVVQNKLQSLKGIEGLSNLNVLNAGKNKLQSMDGVQSLVGLRALILNDNEIVSMCRLDQMKDLNTLVLSRNPISEIGVSLLKAKSITKLSLSNCQVQMVGSSLKFCSELKELRLAHNDIKTLPDDLAYNKKLQNLDLGNNLITRWSDLKVLSSLVGLKNLNLQGNPIAENDKLTKKVRTLLPNLHVFNAKPINKNSKNEKGSIDDKVDDSSHNTANNLKAHKEEKGDHIWLIDSKQQVMRQNEDGNPGDLVMETELKQQRKKLNEKRSKEESRHSIDDSAVKKKLNNKSKEKQHELDNEKNSKRHMTDLNKDGHLNDSRDVDMEKELKRKRKKTDDKLLMEEVQVHYYNKSAEKKQKKRSKEDQSELDVIDDAETSFQEFFSVNSSENQRIYGESKVVEGAHQNMNLVGAVLTSSAKKKKSQNHSMTSALQLSQEVEVGLGGSSTWGDE
ncbi:hypothetical protein ACOSP7_016063 [Xanthoceras sorbifolium]